MGSGGAKKTNQMLAEETRRAQQLQDVAAGRSAEIYGAGRGDIDWARGEYKKLYEGLGAEGGGGGGGGYTPAAFTDETLDFWRKLMAEGAYSPEERGAIESSATAPIKGMFEGLARQMASRAAGGGTGYGGYSGKLATDQAYAASEASKGAFADIAKLVAASKLQGATGLEDIETKRRAFESAERAAARSAAGAAAGRRSAALSDQERLISRILGLEGDKDLAYMDRQLAGMGAGRESIGMRRDETPMWQKAAASIVPAGASAALGAFTGGASSLLGGLGKRKETEGEKAGWFA